MVKESILEYDGIVTELLKNAMFKIRLDNGHQVTAVTAGRLRRNRIRILQNDKVDVDTAIVTVGAENLTKVSCLLLANGFKRLLVEKPGGLNIEEIYELAKMAKSKNNNWSRYE